MFFESTICGEILKGNAYIFCIELEKIHDLRKLSFLLEKSVPNMKDIEGEIILLNRYYIETRYVGDFPEFLWIDAEKSYKAAENVKNFALRKITK